MKNVLLILMAMGLMSAARPMEFERAKEKAAREGKLIVIRFTGSDWCKPCRVMERKVFENDTFKNFAATNLVVIEADFPKNKPQDADTRRQNKMLSRKYQKSVSYPYTVLIDAEGRLLSTWRGYGGQPATDYIGEISGYLPERTAPVPAVEVKSSISVSTDTAASGG
jgi:thioredoxin-related protein